ncbi:MULTISPECIES: glycosyl hydrolase family 18 protein [Streptomyces]|uniref:Glycosyl hydrolase family 18 protein n=1 Tax=Streptomyces silvae TaxID=2803812 RepID=A0ABU8ACE9_9ACTN|nr:MULTISPECIES: glycosyl hydrolase family 18 protein [unclassified Streptomyces]MDX3432039.1 glycosyl hydrolase family 18 protein [Streptomyces sp. ME01-18a]MDX3685538.1 glycosyl hydrolase family 18 protein [Streptomyces sp. AK04-4c]
MITPLTLRTACAVTVAGLLAAAVLATAPGAASAPPPRPSPTPTTAPGPSARPSAITARTVSAWLPYWDQEGAYQDALLHAAQLHTVSPFWYEAVSAGRIDAHPGAGERRIIDGLHRAGTKVVPTVMETMKSGALAAILTSPARRTEHADALMRTVATRDYDGLDLDYESIAATGDSTYASVRDGFTALATDLCGRLHSLGKQCVLTVFPKTATTGRIWDYAALGRVADRIRIMGYNLHWSGGDPGPLADTRWYEDILTRATALVPAAKLEMGLPAYGWDWPADRTGTAATKHVTWKEAEALRKRQGVPYRFDEVSGTPYFTYRDGTESREVWYQDARGIAAHLPVLRKHGVTGTALWALNFEDPEIWPVLADG